jgi:hypothetical protein
VTGRGLVERKSDMIDGLEDVRQRILALASEMDPAIRTEIYLGSWSVREMLAHLAGWDETNIQAADAILRGRLPGFYEFSDKDWASYNKMLVSEYTRDSFDELVALVRDSHLRLLKKVEGIEPEELWRDRGLRARGLKVTIGRLLEAELGDEEEHYLQLQTYLEKGVTT